MAIVLKKPLAQADLLDIWNFIANDSFEKADQFLQKIESQLKVLGLNPGIGRKRDSLAPDMRSFPVGNYLIFYRPISQGIEVIRVLHGSRDIQSLFEDSESD
ncbi:type II toxin-antitoxin system RelE/ParE family toxin [Aetokthonos hydrillicola Thurmond2011]|jgi:toxin ParE1/3/4|uniref:Toxin n=1 Tax=Aetokthonos hydrillicola Thurmond2011 TaxID=2712845 RepID=A0AAP5ID18_9CYAN|nr:type II toxin-antitoxin system RelE/ParE family toxin [Aetokthonos hydrillicola]MBO3464284.1 type II toxin-antitoxin system RelE/ParE family toxin [Aetokthonos hydrillicola CCALA 1050]MBW4585817.1 type II toxin-antitoxin system RelE/ParE family toxin [Aetokthonos hydrillicola CCALA 1050]MDR9899321.1 type II toxin-antitoxin system RelE/ParE family toxin [Aetokthonos hydrillicola Thurmond2011]